MAAAIAADSLLHRPTYFDELPARPRPGRSRSLLDRSAARDQLDERRALDRSDEHDATPRQRTHFVGHPGIAVRRRKPEGGWQCHSSAGAPARDRIAGGNARDRQTDASCGGPAVRCRHIDGERDSEWTRHGVFAQHAPYPRRFELRANVARGEPVQ